MASRRPLHRAIEAFVQMEGSGGIALLAAAVAAVVWVNLPWGHSYGAFWGWGHGFDIGSLHRRFELLAFVNDALMAIFFFLMGLEIKRELVEGELNSLRKAALPAIAAMGGMAAPALIYFAFNAGRAGAHGWGIPMATDIAFAIGVMTLLRSRAPFGLKVFLLGLAIVDDIGAIIVIAIFYSGAINFAALGVGAACVVAVIGGQRLGVRPWPVYVVLGIAAWAAVLESGVHATIAGVALGLAMGAGSRDGEEGTLDRTQRQLHPWVSYGILPIFALANAGVVLSGSDLRAAATSTVALGIGIGLLVGKPIGIVAASWIAVRLKFGEWPAAVGPGDVLGAGMIGGIGFTVSLFITALAFHEPSLTADAKIGIFAGSILSGLIGFSYLFVTRQPAERGDTESDSTPAPERRQGDEPVT